MKLIPDIDTIILAVVAIGIAWFQMRPSRNPTHIDASEMNSRLTVSISRPLTHRSWFVFLCGFAMLVYALIEVVRPGELTKLSVYKIAFGVGTFFFILLHSSISRLTEMFLDGRKEDFEIMKAFHGLKP